MGEADVKMHDFELFFRSKLVRGDEQAVIVHYTIDTDSIAIAMLQQHKYERIHHDPCHKKICTLSDAHSSAILFEENNAVAQKRLRLHNKESSVLLLDVTMLYKTLTKHIRDRCLLYSGFQPKRKYVCRALVTSWIMSGCDYVDKSQLSEDHSLPTLYYWDLAARWIIEQGLFIPQDNATSLTWHGPNTCFVARLLGVVRNKTLLKKIEMKPSSIDQKEITTIKNIISWTGTQESIDSILWTLQYWSNLI